jgi:hypothetical protein
VHAYPLESGPSVSAGLWIRLMTGIELRRRRRKRYCSRGEEQCCTLRSPSYGTHCTAHVVCEILHSD